MATTVTTTPSVDVYLAKPFHAIDMKQWYDAGDLYTDGIDLAATETATDAIIDATSLSPEDKTSVKAAITAAIAANIAQPAFHDILDTVNADMLSVIDGDTTTFSPAGAVFVCPDCTGDGKREILDASGDGTGVYTESELCDGFGFTSIQYTKNPNTGYIQVP